jgi:hypothetical protein
MRAFQLPRPALRGLAVAVSLGLSGLASGADAPAPPQLPAARDAKPDVPTPPSRRRVIRAPEPTPETPPGPARAPATPGVVQWYGEPSDAEQLPPAAEVSAETRIEQKRQANRIVEVIVTPAGSTHSYIMLNQEGQRPRSVQDLGSGLSLPQFLRIPVK